ncbi:ER lumen protein retaining receptor-domain-containing protein [Cokeromyces recurvatus]|uniref:ER lumen protein retaining receptor-domain-containing protein n=1 Tax=Cokeromyces recurvatus TaxID=90255 RepID=UPI00221ED2EE|nr:ER lumen protein retaining receptor-domain-containing protein [Cokeromyces recurvatus]KAI7897684.1 ER lumen protein retaining receptor-domain-containing protein [Cokeromyces recurvatus]
MNIFRLVADLMHLASIIILLLKIKKTHSCVGISFKTQLLYSIVFLTRYLDLFVTKISIYNTIMKMFFITSSLYILYLMYFKYKATYDAVLDTFRIEYLLIGSTVFSLATTSYYTVLEFAWTFSIWLESVAILPQLFMLQRTGEAETITTHYLFALGAYRGLYLINWIYRFVSEGHKDWIAWIAGFIQTALYSDFFYIYYTKVLNGEKFELPKYEW